MASERGGVPNHYGLQARIPPSPNPSLLRKGNPLRHRSVTGQGAGRYGNLPYESYPLRRRAVTAA